MKNFPTLLFSLLSISVFFSLEANSSSVKEADGYSLFDLLLEDKGIRYNGSALPREENPFRTLMKRLSEDGRYFAAVIPFGRSLQKFSAYPDNLRHPRLVLALSSHKKYKSARGRIFLGYTKPSNQLEVISYNPLKGRFEFQLVENFAPGKKAKLIYERRPQCLACHQGGMPIFAGGDWLETTSFNKELQDATEKAIGGKSYLGVPIRRDHAAKNLAILSRPEMVDDMVIAGARLIGFQKAWQEMCTTAVNNCHARLLRRLVLSGVTTSLTLPPEKDLTSRFYRYMPSGNIALPSERLKDHNPMLGQKLTFAMPQELDPTLQRSFLRLSQPLRPELYDQHYKLYNFLVSMGKSFFLPDDFKDISRGVDVIPINIDAKEAREDCKNEGDKLKCLVGGGKKPYQMTLPLVMSSNLPRSKIKGKDYLCLASAYTLFGIQKRDSIRAGVKGACLPFSFWLDIRKIGSLSIGAGKAFRRSEVLDALRDLGLFSGRRGLPKKIRSKKVMATKKEELDLGRSHDPGLKLLLKYCGECHLRYDIPSSFLRGKSLAHIKSQLRKNREKMIRWITKEKMPPPFARKKLSKTDLAKLVTYLKSL